MAQRELRIGDKVRIVGGPFEFAYGREAYVTAAAAPSFFGPQSTWYGKVPQGSLMVALDLEPQPPGTYVAYPPKWLEIVYDGNEKAEWDELTRSLCRKSEQV